MSNPFFSFKQFTIYQDRCAMKVGTDGVLLGAWARVASASRILDIGTGTGLISLMLAQRSGALITAIDIDADAVRQARGNIEASPWKDRVEVVRQDICSYVTNERFDVIVSNPPYFVNSLKCPDGQRSMARHCDCMEFGDLIKHAVGLLLPEGAFSVIIPTGGMEEFLTIASGYNLFLSRQTLVRTKPDVAPKRVLLEFKKQPVVCIQDELVIELSRHVYSEAYIELTKDFYLKM